MKDLEYYELCTKAMGRGEPARVFYRDVPVWSEMAVRAAILRAIQAVEAEEYAEQVEQLQAKLQRLQSTNHHIAAMLSNAERAGGEMDRPEGTRYITLSDTLAREIAKELTAEADEK